MSEKPVEQVAEEHAEWFVGIITPMIKATAKTFFEHGFKHGRQSGLTDEEKVMVGEMLLRLRKLKEKKEAMKK
jgi:hypothetical protein